MRDNVEPGHHKQVRIRRGYFGSDVPPRIGRALERVHRVGMSHDRWYYQKDAEQLLGGTLSGYTRSAWDYLWEERHGKELVTKTGIPRRVSEITGRKFAANEAVLRFTSPAKVEDVLGVHTQLQFSFGTLGGLITGWPLAGMLHRYAIVKVLDEAALRKFLLGVEVADRRLKNSYRSGRVVVTTDPHFSVDLLIDESVGLGCAPLDSIPGRRPDPPPLPTTGEVAMPRSARTSRAEEVAEIEAKIRELTARLAK